MARKVKETPILRGKDAELFERDTKANENKRVSPEDYRRAVNTFNRVKFK